MFKTIAVTLLVFLAAHSGSFAQKSLSLSLGFPSINWGYSGNFDGLRTVNSGGWSITASGLTIKENGLIYGIDLGVNRYGNGFQFGIGRHGIGEIHHFSILPFIGYHHNPKNSKFSIRANLAFGIGYMPSKDRYYENSKSFQTMRNDKKNPDGTISSVPLYDLTFSGSQLVENRVFPLVKPNVELHYALNERSSLFVKGSLGITMMNAVVVRDFPEVIFESEEYHVTHSTSMSYWALELGYSLKLKN
ncbi:hypothetical protein J0A67_14260 [Algoriphagus aestuariicola]|jgi:hypothetical protein|uniref:Outer membrane protein beta-barrel domain-containing protein n=1 Tax=Algoriphagus aestuariicola TaxID=1852016 RepID=A0ABS3BRV7_9BACT|nr:hypothetical protein [Algoriphagus aestuariicola]MBN7802033.1 hypothetical protein [Algoriphagus aestuariicola]